MVERPLRPHRHIFTKRRERLLTLTRPPLQRCPDSVRRVSTLTL